MSISNRKTEVTQIARTTRGNVWKS